MKQVELKSKPGQPIRVAIFVSAGSDRDQYPSGIKCYKYYPCLKIRAI